MKRTTKIDVRLSPHEREIIDRIAERDGLSSSSWVRSLALRTARGGVSQAVPSTDPEPAPAA